jgi:hypothetical protein
MRSILPAVTQIFLVVIAATTMQDKQQPSGLITREDTTSTIKITTTVHPVAV